MESSSHISHPDRTLVIMAKAPLAGKVKTRLNHNLPSHAVTELYRCLLEDTVALARSLRGAKFAVMCPESDCEKLAILLGSTIEVVAQQGEGLAAGLTSVFRHFTATGRQRVIAFNSDSPHLRPSVLDDAFEMLNVYDVVVGPTHDGGYYLVGAKTCHPSLFEGDGLGTRSALDGLLGRTRVLELSTGLTEPFYDIDIASDLVLLAQELRLAPAKAPRTAAWFTEWQSQMKQLRDSFGTLSGSHSRPA
jgi:rSAM/selenodomain-associated transferase 1